MEFPAGSAPGRTAPLVRANVSERALISPELAVSTVVFALAERDEPAERDGPAGRDEPAERGEPADRTESAERTVLADSPDLPRLRLVLPLVRRVRAPFQGDWALPGGPLRMRQSLEEVAGNHLREITGLEPASLEQLRTFGGLDRSPGLRVVSVVYWSVLPLTGTAGAMDRTAAIENVEWFAADRLPPLAFDHAEIIAFAVDRLRNSGSWGSLARQVLSERFTLAQLREAGECIAGHPLDPGNFQRQARADPLITPTDEFLTGGRHRPPRLYTTTARSKENR